MVFSLAVWHLHRIVRAWTVGSGAMAKLRMIFDLDDTLYPEREFALCGFRAAALWAKSALDIDGLDADMTRLLDAGHLGRLFAMVLEEAFARAHTPEHVAAFSLPIATPRPCCSLSGRRMGLAALWGPRPARPYHGWHARHAVEEGACAGARASCSAHRLHGRAGRGARLRQAARAQLRIDGVVSAGARLPFRLRRRQSRQGFRRAQCARLDHGAGGTRRRHPRCAAHRCQAGRAQHQMRRLTDLPQILGV